MQWPHGELEFGDQLVVNVCETGVAPTLYSDLASMSDEQICQVLRIPSRAEAHKLRSLPGHPLGVLSQYSSLLFPRRLVERSMHPAVAGSMRPGQAIKFGAGHGHAGPEHGGDVFRAALFSVFSERAYDPLTQHTKTSMLFEMSQYHPATVRRMLAAFCEWRDHEPWKQFDGSTAKALQAAVSRVVAAGERVDAARRAGRSGRDARRRFRSVWREGVRALRREVSEGDFPGSAYAADELPLSDSDTT
jgi:hypothetical protein